MEKMWQEMADLTFAKCKQTCHKLGSCCSDEYCDMAVEFMQKAGEKVPDKPFVKDGSCTIAPHFRPLCAIHQCKISNIGEDFEDKKWTKKYFKLRAKLRLEE